MREAQASSQCLLSPFKFIVRGNKLALIKRFSQNNVLKLSKLSCTQDQKLCLDYKKYLMTKWEFQTRIIYPIFLQ